MSIKADNITKRFGDQVAVDALSFEVQKGEILGFLGPNGAGKSTTMKMLTGFLSIDEGTVSIAGYDPRHDPISVKAHVGYLPEHNPLYTDLYIREYLRLIAGMHGLKNGNRRVDEVIEMTGLGFEAHKKIGQLSKGYRQRTGLAQALMHDPDVLVLDEPTSGLDPNQLKEIRNLIVELGKNKAIIFSTHIMQEVQAVCDRVLIINRGRMVLDKPIEFLANAISANQVVEVEFDRKILTNSLKAIPLVIQVQEVRDRVYLVSGSGEEDLRPVIFNFAVEKGAVILEMKKQRDSIEDIFAAITRENT